MAAVASTATQGPAPAPARPAPDLAAADPSQITRSPNQDKEIQENLTGLEKQKKKLFDLVRKKDKGRDMDKDMVEGSAKNISTYASSAETAAPCASTSSSSAGPTKASNSLPPYSPTSAPQPNMISAQSVPRPLPQLHKNDVVTPPLNPAPFPAASPQSHRSTVSPSRYVVSSSPHLHSPAESCIFERNVQEAPIPEDLAKEIPHHIQTEDHIPPTLEASSFALTDDKLNPDEVEIVTHSLHLPAASTLVPDAVPAGLGMGLGMGLGGSGILTPLSSIQPNSEASLPMWSSSGLFESTSPFSTAPGSGDDTFSSLQHHHQQQQHYGSIDTTDIRRLSFISFADIVQGEHILDSGLPKDPSSATLTRSPSPMRLPSSQSDPASLSPPTSGPSSVKGIEINPKQVPPVGFGPGAFPASPKSMGSASPPHPVHVSGVGASGEVNVVTMRQVLENTSSSAETGGMSAMLGRSSVSSAGLGRERGRDSVVLGGLGPAVDEAK